MNSSTLIRTCLALVVCFTAQARKRAFQTLADSWAEAYNKHDRSALGGALYTEDALLMMHGAATVSGRNEIADFWSGDFQADNPLTLLKVTQTVQGSDMALVHGDYRVVSRDDGSALSQGRFAHIWTASSNGDWRLDRDLWDERFDAYSADQEVDKAVQTLADRWTQAYNKHDRAALSAIYAQRARLMMHGAPTIAGREDIGAFWGGGLRGEQSANTPRRHSCRHRYRHGPRARQLRRHRSRRRQPRRLRPLRPHLDA